LLAAVSELIRRQTTAQFWAISDGNPDIGIALTLLRHESDQLIPRWDVDATAPRFDLYLLMADVMPADKRYIEISRRAKRTLVGLMFPTAAPRRKRRLTIADGHDTVAFARVAESRIRKRFHIFPNFWRAG